MAIVRSINDIAQTLELHTIAEYVESQPVAMKLRELGIDYYQGNFVAEPRPIDQLARDLDPS